MLSIISVVLTAVLGSYLAYWWQQRSSKESRFFDASSVKYKQMTSAVETISSLIGHRIYSSQRVCRLNSGEAQYEDALLDFRESVLKWNKEYLKTELSIRTLFVTARLNEFEYLQADLAALTSQISNRLRHVGPATTPDVSLVRRLEQLRAEYFQFLQNMIKEADALFRQMHFGVKIEYCMDEIDKFSTWQLVRAIFSGTQKELSITRPPVDFGAPIPARRARLGVD